MIREFSKRFQTNRGLSCADVGPKLGPQNRYEAVQTCIQELVANLTQHGAEHCLSLPPQHDVLHYLYNFPGSYMQFTAPNFGHSPDFQDDSKGLR